MDEVSLDLVEGYLFHFLSSVALTLLQAPPRSARPRAISTAAPRPLSQPSHRRPHQLPVSPHRPQPNPPTPLPRRARARQHHGPRAPRHSTDHQRAQRTRARRPSVKHTDSLRATPPHRTVRPAAARSALTRALSRAPARAAAAGRALQAGKRRRSMQESPGASTPVCGGYAPADGGGRASSRRFMRRVGCEGQGRAAPQLESLDRRGVAQARRLQDSESRGLQPAGSVGGRGPLCQAPRYALLLLLPVDMKRRA